MVYFGGQSKTLSAIVDFSGWVFLVFDFFWRAGQNGPPLCRFTLFISTLPPIIIIITSRNSLYSTTQQRFLYSDAFHEPNIVATSLDLAAHRKINEDQ